VNGVKGLQLFYAVKQCEDLKVKYYEEMTQRKKLFNEVQEAKGILSYLLIYLV
jgi:kinesin family protein C2/C3